MLEPLWSCSPQLQNSFVDLLDTGNCGEEEEQEKENEDEFDDFSESDCDGSSEKIILACYLFTDALINELSRISLFTIPCIPMLTFGRKNNTIS